jgi:catechol 2,3-dioxygenase-like lactoylglutathione lyase family enzyme
MAPAKKKASQRTASLAFNHAMVYVTDVARSLGFYRDQLGFQVIDDFEHHGRLVYARLKPAQGSSTIALHLLEPGKSLPADDAIRLYFEVKDLEKFCGRLEAAGVEFSAPPKLMPWGWKHAYLDDPDGHEVSLYWAGPKRFRKSKMAA